ncbi:hypothetical protein ACXYTP_04970 [Tsukamurella ocularis]|uniref:hypothetical protein n=1 Tax=Tsukamurella ocularis TaxID=1970234 RepID=UPI0039F02D69
MQPLPSQTALLQSAAHHPGGRALVIDAVLWTTFQGESDALARAMAETLAETETAGVGAVLAPDGSVRLVAADRAPVTVRAFGDEDELRRWRARGALALDGGPLVRATVVRRGSEHGVRLLAHHALLDGYSCIRLFRRLADRLAAEDAGATLPFARRGDLAALAAAAAPLRAPDPAFWAVATEGLGEPGHEIAFTDRTAPPVDHPLQYRTTVPASDFLARRSWPEEAVGTVAAYVARHLGTDVAQVGVTAALRRTALERATPTAWVAVVPTRLAVPDDATPVSLAGDLRRWLDAAAERIATGERPEQLLTTIPAAWRTRRVFGPVINVLPDLGLPGWSLDVTAWGPVPDCLLSVYPDRNGEVIVDGVFHPDLYDAEQAAAHVEAIAALVPAALARPNAPLPPIPARPVDPDRVAVPGGWVSPGRLRAALDAAGFTAEEAELRLRTPATVVLHGVGADRVPSARAVVPPGVRVRRA